MNATSKAVDDYFAKLPAEQRTALENIRQLVRSMLPEWQEEIKTNIPAIRYKGKTVVGLGAFQGHVGLYVMFGDALKLLKEELASYDTGNKVIRFDPEAPLPDTLVRKIVTIRINEIENTSAATQ